VRKLAREYVPTSKLPKEVRGFYDESFAKEKELIVTRRKDPLVQVILRKGKLYLKGLTVDDIKRAIDPDTDDRSFSCTSNLVSFDPDFGVLNFVSNCAESRNAWEQRIQFTDDWELVPQEMRDIGTDWYRFVQEFPDVLSFDARVICNCPAFKFNFSYLTTQLDIQLVDEHRPNITVNPNLIGISCKHLVSVLRRFF